MLARDRSLQLQKSLIRGALGILASWTRDEFPYCLSAKGSGIELGDGQIIDVVYCQLLSVYMT